MKILVVDDDPIGRLYASRVAASEGFEVLAAESGDAAVARFVEEAPDLVITDVMMPGMDGREVCRRIKAAAGERFVPVYFLTALSDRQDLATCLEAGGDGFLTKPVDRIVLRAHIRAMSRQRALHERVQRQNEALRAHESRQRVELEIARETLARAVASGRSLPDGIEALLRPAEDFSGDLLLTAELPGGGRRVLLADFMGHGLAAAIGAVPFAETFRGSTSLSLSETVAALHASTCRALPSGRFVAAALADVFPDGTCVVWNGGLPDVLVLQGGGVTDRLVSEHLPMGISTNEPPDTVARVFRLPEGARLVLVSDGLLEAENRAGEPFGESRLVETLPSLDGLVAALERHLDGAAATDDVAVVCIDPRATAPDSPAEPPPATALPTDWSLTVRLGPDALRELQPVPAVGALADALTRLGPRRDEVLFVLAELWTNAVQHGLLRLDSAVKAGDEGFDRFYERRDAALRDLRCGHVTARLTHRADRPGRIEIVVEDDGGGYAGAAASVPDADQTFGRGLGLVHALCSEFRIEDGGRRVEAVLSPILGR